MRDPHHPVRTGDAGRRFGVNQLPALVELAHGLLQLFELLRCGRTGVGDVGEREHCDDKEQLDESAPEHEMFLSVWAVSACNAFES